MCSGRRRADQRGDWDIHPGYYNRKKSDKFKLVKYSVYKTKYPNWEKIAYNVVHHVVLISKRKEG